MRSVQIGDEITLGGIMGRVVTIKEDSLVIETVDRNKIKIARWGIQTNNTAEERLQAEKEAAAAAKAAEKQAAAEALKEKKKKK